MATKIKYNGFPIHSPNMQEVFQQVADFAKQGYPMVLFGPSGSGKEYLARYYFEIYKTNFANNCRFETINCAHLSDNLAVGELFGYVKGIFTGAVTDKEGLLENLKNGVLFLDETGDLDEKVQAMLMRALHTNPHKREGRRLGANKSYPLSPNLSIICATEKPVESIRESLLYRMGAIVHVPGMNERPEDVAAALPWLFKKSVKSIRNYNRFLATLNENADKSDMESWDEFSENISAHLLPLVQSKEWKGNFRSLNATISQAIIRSAKAKTYKHFYDETVEYFKSILPDHTRSLYKAETEEIQVAKSDSYIKQEQKTAALKKVVRIFPRIPKRESEKIADFLSGWSATPFKRSDFESFVDLYNTSRTAQKRLRELVNNKLIQEETKGIYKIAGSSEKDAAQVCSGFFALPDNAGTINLPANIKEEIVPLVQNSRGLYLKAENEKAWVGIASCIGEWVSPLGPVYYFSFESREIESIPEAFKTEITSEKAEPEFDFAWNKLEDFILKTAFISGYLDQLVASGNNPFFILNHTNRLVTKEQKDKLLSMLNLWPFFRFVLIGDKMANELEEFTEYVAG